MLHCLYCLFIILLCTSNLLSPVGWILHRLCEQYRYRQWIKESNIIIIVPDPPPGLSLSVARSANFPASGENCCCNFSPVWAINILCAAASHTVIDAHIAVISIVFLSIRLWLLIHTTLHLSTGGTCASWRGRKMGRLAARFPTMLHSATKPWVCLWKIIEEGCGNKWGWAFSSEGEGPEVVNALTGMQNHTVAFDVRSSPWRQQCDLWEVEPGGNVIVFIVGAPALTTRRTA